MRWRKYLTLLRIVLTFLILGIVILKVDATRIFRAFQSLNVSYFVLAIGIVPVNLCAQFYRWNFMLKTGSFEVNRKEVFRSILTGLTLSLVTPGRIGEIGRALYVRSSHPIRIAGLVLLEKIFAFFATVIVAAISIMLWGFEIAGLLLIVCTLVAAFHLSLIQRLLSRLSFLLPFGSKVAELWSAWDLFDRKKIAHLLGISLGFLTIVFLQFYILVSSFQGIEIIPAIISIALTLTANCLPITVAGLGVREVASVFFFSEFNVVADAAVALNGAFLLFAIDILIPGIIGIPLIPNMRIKLKQLEEERK